MYLWVEKLIDAEAREAQGVSGSHGTSLGSFGLPCAILRSLSVEIKLCEMKRELPVHVFKNMLAHD